MSFVKDHVNSCMLLSMEQLKEKNPQAAILSSEAANTALVGSALLNGEVYAEYDGMRLLQMGVSEEELGKLENIAISFHAVLPQSAVNLAFYNAVEVLGNIDPAVTPLPEDASVKDRMEFNKIVGRAYLGLLAACMQSNTDIVSVLATYLTNDLGPEIEAARDAADKESDNERDS